MSHNNLSDSLNARIDAHVARIHNRPHHYVLRAFLASEEHTLSVEDILNVFDSINQRSNTTALREQTGRVSGVISDAREYDAANIVSHAFNRQVTHYTLLNAENFSNTGFSLAENHVTNRGRFKQRLNRELYDAIKNERVKKEMIENEAIVSETVTLAEFESHLPKHIESTQSQMTRDTVNEVDDEQAMNEEFALDASDASETRKFKRRDNKRKSVAEDDSQSVAA